MGKREEKHENLRDTIIPLHSPSELGGPQVVDLRKGRPKEEKWSYLIALLIPVLIFVIVMILIAFA